MDSVPLVDAQGQTYLCDPGLGRHGRPRLPAVRGTPGPDVHPLDCSWISLDQPPAWNLRAEQKSVADQHDLRVRGLALSAGQREPLERKIDFALRVLERAQTTHDRWAISYSGGRDSTVLSHLAVAVMGWRVPHVMSNTRMEDPSTLRQAAAWGGWLAHRGTRLETVVPERRPESVWAAGLPLWSKHDASKYRKWVATDNGRHVEQVSQRVFDEMRRARAAGIAVTDRCCDSLKKEPLARWDAERGILGHLTGLRAEESQARRMGYLQRGALYYSTSHQQWLGTPLIHWTRDDIDTYLRRNGIEVQTTGRSGCVTCAFGAHLAADAGDENNLQKLHQSNPKMWLQALDGWGYRPALDTIHVAYRHVGPHGTQNTLSSEHALSPQVPMQDLPVEWHPTAFEAHLSAIPRDLFADHLDRLARRDRGWEGLDVGAWTDVPSLAKLVEIPTRVLAERLQGDASGTWERRRTEVGGVGLLEVRALDAERACDHLDQWCVAHDRDHRAAILDAVVDLRPRPADHPRQEIHSFSA